MYNERSNLITYIIKIPLLLFFVSAISLLLIYGYVKPGVTDKAWKEYKTALDKNEVVIDHAVDDKRAFLITNKRGNKKYGDTLVVLQKLKDGGWRRVYDNDFNDLKPWVIKLSDIDGDKVKEIITAVRKTTHFDKSVKNRLFIFNYTKGKLVKKWTGSQIAGVWEEFAVGDLAPIRGNEIAFVSKTVQGDQLSIYYWYTFGFFELAKSNVYEDITDISVKNKCIQLTYSKGGKKLISILTLRGGKLVENTKVSDDSKE